MRFYQFIALVVTVCLAVSCAPKPKPLTPLETLQAYTRAIKRKDITQMKLLLSAETIRMAENSAKVENVTVDDIVKRENLFTESQTTVRYRNVREEADRATIEMEDSAGLWNTVTLVREDGVWKIDRKSFANQIEQEVEQRNKALDDLINQGK